MKAAFFDLDGTLLRVNSANLWIRRERRLGRVRFGQLLHASVLLLGYRLGVLDMERALRAALGTLRGVDEDHVRSETKKWWIEEVRPHVALAAKEVIAKHRAEGDRLVLLTSSSIYASEMALADFGLDAVLCQRYEVRDRRFTGEPIRPICYGPGKVEVARAWAAENGVDLRKSSFYSDSSTDVPMLESVGRPYVVNPDPRLRFVAKRRGWPILQWS